MTTSDPLPEFTAERSRLLGLAYRLLGSASEAEDVVQDAFLRWNSADRADVESPSAWLRKVVTNLCLNRLTSARMQRERYVGYWLPEPVLTVDGALGPLESAEQRESVSMALLVLMEQLTPTERAVFVLREAFAYRHQDIAEVLEISEANSRQLHRRARQRLDEQRPRHAPDSAQWTGLVERFLAAAQQGDLPGLEAVLSADVVSWADGGGTVSTARRPILGRSRVARYLTGGLERFAAGARFTIAEVNGRPALLGWVGEEILGVVTLEVLDGLVTGLWIVANPEKLKFVSGQLSHPDRLAGS